MKKAELIEKIAHHADLSNSEATRALNATLATIQEALTSGEEVALIGFGTFKVSHRNARTGRNPKTGEALNIPAAKVPQFKPGKLLKESVNK
ncbi:DNA-binding protein HU-alpha [Vibrio ishigakensis]|uniref:DNA-binding protein HU-alpha n=1 Tax=Vibrio ishigakensis TaxID=1481914 RepID=A0A0B8PQU4_9VIBR|nr:DNA-binding protein HU-alpha [Vibrio ishigakensis]